ncbi:MAG: hypothetical protein A3G87_04395 [Omnitrophica bacterium RIFCSPLOWO2_12_FULL_50_11]|nr:MAG: hypothetical protein A3G87_04395 [Omnitrophica bacterium RIFCSPLOWO2_12_FULL_50_11]
MQRYTLQYTPEALQGIAKLTPDLKRIAERVLLKIAENPSYGKRLSGPLKSIWSARVTRRYRMLYLVNHTDKKVIVLDVGHRKNIYD